MSKLAEQLPLADRVMDSIHSSRSTQMFYQINYDISTTIFHKRKESGMTYRLFAEYLGVSKYKLHRFESGDYNFTLEELCRICDRLDLNIQVRIIKGETK